MKIGIVLMGGQRLNTEADPEMFAGEIIEQLVENNKLAQGDYVISFKDTHDRRQLNQDQTLAQNGVDENDTLAITASAAAGFTA